MTPSLLYLLSSFWLGGLHAATPGHGKTIAAAYIVGLRGRPVDAVVLGIFVTLSHTFGIILVGVLASLGSAWTVPQRVEAFLAVGTGLLVIGIGFWMLGAQWALLRAGRRSEKDAHAHSHSAHEHAHDHYHEHGHVHSHRSEAHHHDPDQPNLVRHFRRAEPAYHRHGWGPSHTHDIEALAEKRPSLPILLWLAIAGGILPDPGALAILLAAVASGKLMLGLFTVIFFSLGFASVLVIVGVVAARVGELVLTWLNSQWLLRLQVGLSLVIIAMGIFLTTQAFRTVAAFV